MDVLKRLYELRLTLLDLEAPLKNLLVNRFNSPASAGVFSWWSPATSPAYFNVNELTPLVQKTRELLADYFETRFFNRYIDREIFRSGSYGFELQMLLHPNMKNLDKTTKRVMQKIHGAQVMFL